MAHHQTRHPVDDTETGEKQQETETDHDGRDHQGRKERGLQGASAGEAALRQSERGARTDHGRDRGRATGQDEACLEAGDDVVLAEELGKPVQRQGRRWQGAEVAAGVEGHQRGDEQRHDEERQAGRDDDADRHDPDPVADASDSGAPRDGATAPDGGARPEFGGAAHTPALRVCTVVIPAITTIAIASMASETAAPLG